jgi:hypothetical protein
MTTTEAAPPVTMFDGLEFPPPTHLVAFKAGHSLLPSLVHGTHPAKKRDGWGSLFHLEGASADSSFCARLGLRAAITTDGLPRSGSLNSRCTCSGITT